MTPKKWKEGGVYKYKDSTGKYRNYIYLPNHPSGGCVIYSRWVMEQKLGRYLSTHEIVHHINKDPSDDRLENLRVYKNQKEHFVAHGRFAPYGSIDDGDEYAVMVKNIFNI